MTKIYNHMFSIGFSLESSKEDGSDVTEQDLLNALLKRIADCSTGRDAGLIECCGPPEDTYETPVKDALKLIMFHKKVEFRDRFGLKNEDVGID